MRYPIYIISGLGADERVFQYLDLSGYDVTHIQWIQPKPEESLQDYALRLCSKIKDNDPILVGMSFGGIVAIEMAKQIQTRKIILIASVKTRKELPGYLKVIGYTKLYKFFPAFLLKFPNLISYWFFGIEGERDKELFQHILHDTNPAFLKWAVDKILNWKNSYQHNNLIHIHGTIDRVFPFTSVKADIAVEQGGHFMTVNKAKQLTIIIREVLSRI